MSEFDLHSINFFFLLLKIDASQTLSNIENKGKDVPMRTSGSLIYDDEQRISKDLRDERDEGLLWEDEEGRCERKGSEEDGFTFCHRHLLRRPLP